MIQDVMFDLSEKRRGKFLSIVTGEIPDMLDVMEPAWIGDFTMSTVKTKRRVVAQDVAMTPFYIPQSPTELVRDYLTAKYTFPVMATRNQLAALAQPEQAPLYARVGLHSDCCYIDIKSAYWQIVQAVGWDVDYFPHKYLAQRSEMSDMPAWLIERKIARASLVSMARRGNASFWTGNSLIYKPVYNKYLNSSLVMFVNDVLMSVASDVKSRVNGLVYVNTDGYIVYSEQAREVFAILQEWGLQWSMKGAGRTEVHGVGSYTVGKRQSKRGGQGFNFDNIAIRDTDWLKKRFIWFIHNAVSADWTEPADDDTISANIYDPS